MDALAYYLARQKGEDPDLAMEAPGVQDSSPPPGPPGPPGPAPQGQPPPGPPPPGLQTSAPPLTQAPPPAPAAPPPGPSQWQMPAFPAQPPPGPPPSAQPPAQQAPSGISTQLAAALARGQQRQAMPENIGDDALAKQLESDDQDSNRNKVIESLRAAFTRQQPNMAGTDSGPSGATKALMQRRQTFQAGDQQDRSDALKAAEILKGEQPKPLDPSLVALHDASALQLAGLQKERETAETRRQAEDDLKKKTADTTKAEADASVEQQRAVLAHDPRLKKMGITPDMVTKLDRKGIEDLTHELGGRGPNAGAGGPKLKTLPAEQLASLGDFDTATKSVDELAAAHKAAGMSGGGSSVASMIPSGVANFTGIGSKTAEYNDRAHATAQAVGIILEHGKLSDRDVPRYLHMLPEPGDSDQRVAEKAANIHRLLQDEKASRLKTFGEGGYNTPKGDAGGDTVRVRRKSDGTTGSMPRSKVDPAKYEIVQ